MKSRTTLPHLDKGVRGKITTTHLTYMYFGNFCFLKSVRVKKNIYYDYAKDVFLYYYYYYNNIIIYIIIIKKIK